MSKMRMILAGAGLLMLAAGAGCESTVVPLHDVVPLAEQVPAEAQLASSMPAATEAASAPASTQAATATASTEAATAPASTATAPAPALARTPNETVRLVYRPNYDQVFSAAEQVLTDLGFRIDRRDYRLGTVSTLPREAPELLEFWRPDQAGLASALENTINDQRWTVTITIRQVEGRPEFYAIGAQVLVERQTNPSGMLGGPVFAEGSGFGRNALTLQTDFGVPVGGPGPEWYLLGHEPNLEKKVLEILLKRI